MLGMFAAADIAGIERTIAMSIAPAFLISGIFGALNVLANRLARLIDRERDIRDGLSQALPGERRRLAARARCANYAIGCSVLSAILLSLMIVVSFIGVVFELLAAFVVAALLMCAMVAMIGALGFFFAEVRLAAEHLPLGEDT
jgi:uncharacterized membrane protein YgcG